MAAGVTGRLWSVEDWGRPLRSLTSSGGQKERHNQNKMKDEWIRVNRFGQLVKFTYDDLPEGKAFLTAQIAGHEVVCSVILAKPALPFSREGVESHFEQGIDFGLPPSSK